MEALQYETLREAGNNQPSPSLSDIQLQWARSSGDFRRRGLRRSVEILHNTLQEIDFKKTLNNVWGQTSTPALQTLECIQKVKMAMCENKEVDSISQKTLVILMGSTFAAAILVLFLWEFYFRPR